MRAISIASCIIATALLLQCNTPAPSGGGSGGMEELPNLDPPPDFVADDSLVPPPALGAGPLLNEIRFDPIDPDVQFVELKGVKAADLTAGLSLRNENGDTFVIPRAALPADANGIITTYFDSQNSVAGDTVHADRGGFLNASSGTLTLLDANSNAIDSVAWGMDRGDSVALEGGGLQNQPFPDSTIGRKPQSILPNDPNDWATYPPLMTTPGKPNRNLGVLILLPGNGALLEAGDRKLSWYPVPEAAQYHVVVASDAAFTDIVADQMVSDPVLPITLTPGGYTWRVQAMLSDGTVADFSPSSQFRVVDGFDAFFTANLDASSRVKKAAGYATTVSPPVPLYAQRKDTYMLLLQSDSTKPGHAWNAPHAVDDGRFNDLGDFPHCSAASISMVNGFYANTGKPQPNLSQDRISLVARTMVLGQSISPNDDLLFGRDGMNPDVISAGLQFAIGIKPTVHDVVKSGTIDLLQAELALIQKKSPTIPPAFQDAFWNDLRASIDANKPVIFGVWQPGASWGHTMVCTHYSQTDTHGVKLRWIGVNDPWFPEFRWQLVEETMVADYFILPDGVVATPQSDLPEYLSPPSTTNGNDDDDDGVLNFDEINRFGTNPKNADSDGDCVNDLAEITASVFNKKHGWGTFHEPFHISDGSLRMSKPAPELDGISSDSDGGGLPDPLEDFNTDGMVQTDQGETDPHDPSDDPTLLTGTYRLFRDTQTGTPGTPGYEEINQDLRVAFALTADGTGKYVGTAHVTKSQVFTDISFPNPPDCPSQFTITTTADPLAYDTDAVAMFECQRLIINPVPAPSINSIGGTIDSGCFGTSRTSFTPYPGWKGFSADADTIVSKSHGIIMYHFMDPVRNGSAQHMDFDVTLSK